MRIALINTGKTDKGFLKEGISNYEKRLAHYCSFSYMDVNPGSSAAKLPSQVLKQKEAQIILKKINSDDYVVLLDERGKQMKSVALASWLNRHLSGSAKQIVFISGGAYGFHEDIYRRANEMISLSMLTFPHQLVRIIFLEQLYRAFTIIRNEPYHNE